MLDWLRAERRRRLWLLPRHCSVRTFDLEYQPGLLARVYQPAGVGAFAAALDVHGGNWTSGDRCQQEQLDRALAANGVLVAAIDYRLAPPNVYPASVEDVHVAAAWLRSRATSLGARTGAPVGALGSSAGGHLVILTTLRTPAAFDFVVADAPITDTSGYAERHPYWPTREAAIDGSPLHAVEGLEVRPTSQSAARNAVGRTSCDSPDLETRQAAHEAEGSFSAAFQDPASLPPLLVTHGTLDDAVPIETSREFAKRYGGRLLEFPGLGHAFILTHPRKRESREMAKAILRFIENQRRR